MDSRDFEEKLLANVDAYGWQCNCISSDDGPSFSYSIGFTKTLSRPEFIVFGLPDDSAYGILANVYEALKAGKMPEDGQRWSELADGFDLVIKAVHPTNIVREYLNSAIWFWGDPAERGVGLSAFQIVWPSPEGLFPWDPGCPQWVIDDQLALYNPRPH